MKPFEAQSYYELLEVSVSATGAEIEAAFNRLSRLYGDDQMSLYGLVEPQRAKELKSRLDEARQVLTNDALRAEYDKRIGLPPRARAQPAALSGDAQTLFPELLPAHLAGPASTSGKVAVSWVPAHEPRRSPPVAAEVIAAPTAASSVATADHAATRTSSGETPAPAVSTRSEPPRAEGAPVSSASPPLADRPAPPPPSAPRAEPRPAPALPSAPRAEPRPAPAPPSEPPAAPEPSALAVTQAPPRESAPPPPPEGRARPVEIPEGAVFNGALLKRVREARGLTLQTLSDRTRIGVRHLENLEADRYAQLPAMVYLRGMLMSLSRELGIDGLKVSRSYLSLVEQAKGEQAKG